MRTRTESVDIQLACKRELLVGLSDNGLVYVTVDLRPKLWGLELSITGVEGPKANGDCRGSAGQCIEAVEGCAPREPWTVEMRDELVRVWREWHMNGIRAGCEHQRRDWDPGEPVEVVRYALTGDARREQVRLIEVCAMDAALGESRSWTPQQKALLGLCNSWFRTVYQPPDADGPLSGCYEVTKRELKAAGWAKPDEHPRGLLMKPCEECGYKYGSAWLHEQLPDSVIAFLRGLPTDNSNPWVKS